MVLPQPQPFEQRLQVKKSDLSYVSAAVMKADVDKVASSGMNDHIAKPIDIKNMTKVLTKWIKVTIN